MEQYGYDVTFVNETPDYLQCPLCHLAMRDPVMIIACGHKYCGPCFRRLEVKMTTATNNNQQLLTCPVDNAVIDVSQVVPDLGLARVIGCLVVRCDNKPRGCQWEGELSELPTHHKKCEFILPPPQASANQDVLASIARLEKRIEVAEKRAEVAENRADIAEKDVAHMGHMLKEHTEKIKELELKDRINTKEIEALKKENYRNKTKEELRNNLAKGKAEENGKLGAASCMKPAVGNKVKTSILLKLHIGSPKDVTFSLDNTVHFNKKWSTVAAPDVVVQKGEKVMYEVKVKMNRQGVVVGWATNGFAPNNDCNMCVGGCENSWGYSALGVYKCHNKYPQWGKGCEQDGRHHVLGVALDMVRGQMLYGWDGVWDPPMGLAFKVDTHLQLFPAITGYNVDVQVNFGDTPLSFGGPDHSYKSLVQM